MDDLDLGSTIKGLVPGQKLFARYTLERLLGRGGMGVVWLARDEELGRQTALKFLPEAVANDRGALDDLKREVRRAIDLAHPHIVKIHDFVTDGRSAAVSMEYVAGDTLSALRVDQPGRVFSVASLHPWIEQLCGALGYAHETAQVVHRDLKPANLMVDGRGRLKVLDFGIAASLSESVTRVSRQAGSSGTPVYMSPQQMMGEKPAVTDDVYALGATLYELLTGKPPFYSGNVFMQVQNKVPPPIAERRQELEVVAEPVPPAWEETIAACLAKEPSARPQSAAEVWKRLNGDASAGLNPEEGPQKSAKSTKPDPARTERPAGRDEVKPSAALPGQSKIENRKSKILAAGAVIAVVAVVGWWFGIHAPEQARLAEATRLEREREAAAARAQAEREQAAFAAIAARIDSVVDGSPAALREQVEAAVREYLQTAPERLRPEVDGRWQARRAAWEAARLAAARGGVIVRTSPPGAEVTVGSFGLGASPLTVREARLGTFPVRARLAGYEEWTGEITVREDAFAELDIPLVRSTGTLALASEPAGLEVEVVGRTVPGQPAPAARQVARTPAELKLPTGSYEVTFRREGWSPQARTVEVGRNTATPAAGEFVGGSVVLTTTPAGAEVTSGGRVLGRTPLRLDGVQPGRLEAELRLAGYLKASVVGEVVARQELRLGGALERIPVPEIGRAYTIPDLGLEILPIAPGTFQMGSVSGGGSDERPVTRVTLTRPYWLGKTEVTQAQWEAVMGSNPSHFKGSDRPVEEVSWDDAMAFCRKLTERERAADRLPAGYAYTLPTEAQWEYACRAGTTGDYAGSLGEVGWYAQNSSNQTQPVGRKQANAWGLHDMHGNVWEWCLDWYGNYPGGSVTDPTGASSGSFRVNRGGSWFNTADYCRSADRGGNGPGYRLYTLGFRLALSSVP